MEIEKISDTSDDDELLFVQPPSKILFCSICQELYKNPVITRECNHTFCEVCLNKVSNQLCPLCRTKISLQKIHKNLAIDQLVKEVLLKCKYHKHGCKANVTTLEKRIHEEKCEYREVNCPHVGRGCVSFRGPRSAVSKHLEECVFEKFKTYIAKSENQIESLKRLVQFQSGEILRLQRQISSVSDALIKSGVIKSEILQEKRQDIVQNSFQIKERLSCVKTLKAHVDTVEALTANDTYFFSGSWDRSVKVWDAERLEVKETLTCSSDVRELLLFNNYIYCGCGNGTLQAWNLETFQLDQTARKHDDDVLALQIFDNRVYSGSADRTIKVWNPVTLKVQHSISAHSNWVFALASAHGKIFSGSSDAQIKVWTSELQPIQTLAAHTDQVRALAVSENRLFSGSYDCSVKVWDISNNNFKLIQSIPVQNEVFGLDIVGNYLVVGDELGIIKILDLNTLNVVEELTENNAGGHSGSVYAFAVVNGTLLSASSDTTVKVWK